MSSNLQRLMVPVAGLLLVFATFFQFANAEEDLDPRAEREEIQSIDPTDGQEYPGSTNESQGEDAGQLREGDMKGKSAAHAHGSPKARKGEPSLAGKSSPAGSKNSPQKRGQ